MMILSPYDYKKMERKYIYFIIFTALSSPIGIAGYLSGALRNECSVYSVEGYIMHNQMADYLLVIKCGQVI